MQLNSLFSFLGKSALQEDGEASLYSTDGAKSSGFASMLAATLSLLTHKGGESGGLATLLQQDETGEVTRADSADLPVSILPSHAEAVDVLSEGLSEAKQSVATTLSIDGPPNAGLPATEVEQHAAGLRPDAEIPASIRDAMTLAEGENLLAHRSSDDLLSAEGTSARPVGEVKSTPGKSLFHSAESGSIRGTFASDQPVITAGLEETVHVDEPDSEAVLQESDSTQHDPGTRPASSREGTSTPVDQKGRHGGHSVPASPLNDGAEIGQEVHSGTLTEEKTASADVDAGTAQRQSVRSSIDAPEAEPTRAPRAETNLKLRAVPKSGPHTEPNLAPQTEPNGLPRTAANRAHVEVSPAPSADLEHEAPDFSEIDNTLPAPATSARTPGDGVPGSRSYVRAADLGRASHFSGSQFRVWRESASPDEPVAPFSQEESTDAGTRSAPEVNSAGRKPGMNLAQPTATALKVAPMDVEHEGAATANLKEVVSESQTTKSADVRSGVDSDLIAETGHRPIETEAKTDRSGKAGEKRDVHGAEKTTPGSGSANSGADDFSNPQQSRNSTVAAGETLFESESEEFDVANAQSETEQPIADTPGDEVSFAPEKPATSSSITATDAVQANPRARAAGAMAWIRSLLSESLRTVALDRGWKVLEMPLENGQGSMTVRARRDEDKVSVSVSFTDPQLRAMAEANADRLRIALQEQYESNVDFSLMSGGAGESPQQRRESHGPGGASSPLEAGIDPAPSTERGRTTRTALSGARNEWVG